MSYYDSTNLLKQARTLVRAIEALDAVTPESWFEHIVVALVRTIYLQRLRRLAGMIPRWAMRWVAIERESGPGAEGAVADGDWGVVVRETARRDLWRAVGQLAVLPRWQQSTSRCLLVSSCSPSDKGGRSLRTVLEESPGSTCLSGSWFAQVRFARVLQSQREM